MRHPPANQNTPKLWKLRGEIACRAVTNQVPAQIYLLSSGLYRRPRNFIESCWCVGTGLRAVPPIGNCDMNVVAHPAPKVLFSCGAIIPHSVRSHCGAKAGTHCGAGPRAGRLLVWKLLLSASSRHTEQVLGGGPNSHTNFFMYSWNFHNSIVINLCRLAQGLALLFENGETKCFIESSGQV